MAHHLGRGGLGLGGGDGGEGGGGLQRHKDRKSIIRGGSQAGKLEIHCLGTPIAVPRRLLMSPNCLLVRAVTLAGRAGALVEAGARAGGWKCTALEASVSSAASANQSKHQQRQWKSTNALAGLALPRHPLG